MDGTRVRQRIRVESSPRPADVVQIEIPFWLPRLDGLTRHPCCETFVQPNVVPPFHGDKIAKPLVSHLMGNYGGNGFLQIDRALLLVDQENDFTKGDTTRILHSARGKIRQTYEIKFSVGIFNIEIFVVVAEDVLRRFQGKLPHLLLTGSAVDADRNAVGFALDVFEVT